ncbi:MAG: hypothetical protein H7X97_09025 [Opitutaceae bacterium]|nr:hypothetical protein [Verrucomicrobiales bacterium]
MNSVLHDCPPSFTTTPRRSHGRSHRVFLIGGLALLCATLFSGCRSMTMPASASFASVVIAGHSVQEIEKATVAVFQADGYRASLPGGGVMVFEKEGSRQKELAYSGLSGERVDVRVRAEIEDLGTGSHRLQCQAFIVQDAGDSFFAEENRLSNLRRLPYQKLLDEAAKRLK